MEWYFGVVGNKPSVDRWVQDMLSLYLPAFKDGKQQVENGRKLYQRVIVAPMQIYKIVTYKENEEQLMNLIGSGDYIQKRYKWIDKSIKWIRKLVGLKPIPRPTKPHPLWQPNQSDKAVAVIPIGKKEDFVFDGKEQT